MINFFMGFPGDGKTISLLNYCRTDNVEKESKLIIYDDSFFVGQSEQIREHCSITVIDHITQEIIDSDFLNAKSKEGKNLYIDSSQYYSFSDHLNMVGSLEPLNRIFVIDAMRLLYISDQLEFEKFDSLIITKVDLLKDTKLLSELITQLPKTIKLFISDWEHSTIKSINDYEFKIPSKFWP